MNFRTLSASEIAEFVGGKLLGSNTAKVNGAGSLATAKSGQITFAAKAGFKSLVEACKASILIVGRDMEATPTEEQAFIQVDKPYLAFARTLAHMTEPRTRASGVHEGAWVAPSASLAEGVVVMPGAYVGEDVVIGAHTILYPGAVVMEGACIGSDCVLHPNSVVMEDCVLGDRVILNPNCSIGGEGFGFTQDGKIHVKIPQVGTVVIGDDVEVGANTSVDRAALGETLVGKGSKLDSQVQIGHGVKLGENVIAAAHAGVAGSSTIGDNTILAGRAGVADHVNIGPNTLILARATVLKDIPGPGPYSGQPARPHKEQLKLDVRLSRIDKLMERVAALEEEIDKLKG